MLTATALELFEKVYDRRLLIRLVGAKFSDFVTGTYQIDLFSDSLEKISLQQAIDGIKKRFGRGYIKKAVCL